MIKQFKIVDEDFRPLQGSLKSYRGKYGLEVKNTELFGPFVSLNIHPINLKWTDIWNLMGRRRVVATELLVSSLRIKLDQSITTLTKETAPASTLNNPPAFPFILLYETCKNNTRYLLGHFQEILKLFFLVWADVRQYIVMCYLSRLSGHFDMPSPLFISMAQL